MASLQWVMKSKIGDIYLVASEDGLERVMWERQVAPLAKSLNAAGKEVEILSRTVKQLEEYLDGKRQEFDLPMLVSGTEFQRRVWKELARIPYGKTFSYSDIARKIKNEKAVRAVGTANGRNLLGIIVPCHRVIAADGTLGGYAGGLEIKTKLLNLERQLS